MKEPYFIMPHAWIKIHFAFEMSSMSFILWPLQRRVMWLRWSHVILNKSPFTHLIFGLYKKINRMMVFSHSSDWSMATSVCVETTVVIQMAPSVRPPFFHILWSHMTSPTTHCIESKMVIISHQPRHKYEQREYINESSTSNSVGNLSSSSSSSLPSLSARRLNEGEKKHERTNNNEKANLYDLLNGCLINDMTLIYSYVTFCVMCSIQASCHAMMHYVFGAS